MVKNDGKIFNRVSKLLCKEGFDNLNALSVATLSRGPDHLVVLDENVIGEYNHVSDRLFLYPMDDEEITK